MPQPQPSPEEQNLDSLAQITKSLANPTAEDAALIKKAFIFAERAHLGHERLSGEPYLKHLSETAQILSELGAGSATIVAGLLHDIGIIFLPEEKQTLLGTKYEDFSDEDWKLYKTHPHNGAKLLDGKEYVNSDILELIKIHEERSNGEGFPTGTKELTLIQEAMAMCSCYSRKVTCLKMTHQEALQDFQINEVGRFNLTLLKKFQDIMRKERLSDYDDKK